MASPVKINTYSYPAGQLGTNTTICGIVMLLSARRGLISPGSPLYDYVLSKSPYALKGATWIQNGLFYFLFGAHTIETIFFAWAKLRKHGVPFGLTWLKWVVTCFVGGKFCMEHFDNLVKAKGGR
jgi:hypothetical protein